MDDLTPDLLVPHFQPIISIDSLNVAAFEVLSRITTPSGACSLGALFEDTAVSDEKKFYIDSIVRDKAFAEYSRSGSQALLFVNLKPSWVFHAKGKKDKKVPLLNALEKFKIDPKNIVVEVTEEELLENSDDFSEMLACFRSEGCMLAIDDFGKGSSNFERIAHVMPDIIKIDHSIVRQTEHQRSFFDICSAMNRFGSQVGFDLLYEGVETTYQLERCIQAKGRYFQGFIFSEARPKLDLDYSNRQLLGDIVWIQHAYDMAAFTRRSEIKTEIDNCVVAHRDLLPSAHCMFVDESFLEFASFLPFYCLSICLCSRDGNLHCQELRLTADGVATSPRGPGNYFLRDFFPEALDNIQAGATSYLSLPYKDMRTKEDIVTYVRALRDDLLVCVNIMATQAV